jgi:hypothetical protein
MKALDWLNCWKVGAVVEVNDSRNGLWRRNVNTLSRVEIRREVRLREGERPINEIQK